MHCFSWPGDPIYTMKRAEVCRAEMRQKVDSTEGNPFGSDSIDDTFAALSAAMMGPAATGTRMSLAELMGVQPATPVAPSPAQPPGQPASSGVGFGFGFNVACSVASSAADPSGSGARRPAAAVDQAATPKSKKPRQASAVVEQRGARKLASPQPFQKETASTIGRGGDQGETWRASWSR